MNVHHFVHFLFWLLPKKEYEPPSCDVIALMRFFMHGTICWRLSVCLHCMVMCGFNAVAIVHLTGRWQNWDRTGSDRIGPDWQNPDQIGSDRIGSHRTHKTWIGSGRTHKKWIGSNSIKETHIYSLKVGALQIPIKNGQVVSLDQDDEERSEKAKNYYFIRINVDGYLRSL